jgi:hypothetical protein
MTVAGSCSSPIAAASALDSDELNCALFCCWISSSDMLDG